MYVKDLMKMDIATCTEDDTAEKALELMGSRNFGFLPITKNDHDLTLVGVVTDRDIAMYLGWANKRPSEVKLSEFYTRRVHSVKVDDNIRQVLLLMEEFQIHRVPVVSNLGKIIGVISLKEIADEARFERNSNSPAITEKELAEVIEEISRRRIEK